MDVNKGCQCLDGAMVLCVIQEVFNARLKVRIPLKDIEL